MEARLRTFAALQRANVLTNTLKIKLIFDRGSKI